MSGTKLIEVRQALVDGLRSLEDFATQKATVTLTWDSNSRARVQAFTARGRFTHRPASLRSGPTVRNEDGTFELFVQVELPGGSADETLTLAGDLGVAAEEWISEHRSTLGVAGVNWFQVEGEGEVDSLYRDGSTLSYARYSIAYNARLD